MKKNLKLLPSNPYLNCAMFGFWAGLVIKQGTWEAIGAYAIVCIGIGIWMIRSGK